MRELAQESQTRSCVECFCLCVTKLVCVACCRLQERIAQARDDIEKQRKNLQKRKPPSSEALEKKRAKKDNDGFVRPAEKR